MRKEPCWDDQRAQEGTGGGRVEGGGVEEWKDEDKRGGGYKWEVRKRCRWREGKHIADTERGCRCGIECGRKRSRRRKESVDSNTNLSSSLARRRGGGAMGTTKELLHPCKHTTVLQ